MTYWIFIEKYFGCAFGCEPYCLYDWWVKNDITMIISIRPDNHLNRHVLCFFKLCCTSQYASCGHYISEVGWTQNIGVEPNSNRTMRFKNESELNYSLMSNSNWNQTISLLSNPNPNPYSSSNTNYLVYLIHSNVIKYPFPDPDR